jgi:hypothetical protein
MQHWPSTLQGAPFGRQACASQTLSMQWPLQQSGSEVQATASAEQRFFTQWPVPSHSLLQHSNEFMQAAPFAAHPSAPQTWSELHW